MVEQRVAYLDKASDLGSEHCGFESRRVVCRFKSCPGQPFCHGHFHGHPVYCAVLSRPTILRAGKAQFLRAQTILQPGNITEDTNIYSWLVLLQLKAYLFSLTLWQGFRLLQNSGAFLFLIILDPFLPLPKRGQWPASTAIPLHPHNQQGNPGLPWNHLKPIFVGEYFS